MCSIDPEGWCEVWEEQAVKAARKEHRCSSCNATIPKGEPYVRHFSVYEGEPTSEKICKQCEAARDEFEEEHRLRIPPSALDDTLQECIESREDFRSMLKWARKLRALEKRRAAAWEP